MKKRIFISYKRDDKDIVFKIKDDIEKNVGELCWIDLDDIKCDANYFVDVISKSIDEADVFLFMYSNKHTEITDFENDWPLRELNYAQEEKKRIIFLNIDKAPLTKRFKLMFGLKQQVDATSTSAMNKLYRDLNKWLSDGDNDKKGGSENDNSEICYKVRVNRACWLYLDDEKMQPLEANKIVKFYLESGVYLRKVVDCEDENVSKEDKITLSEKQVFEDIDLATLYQKYVKGNTKRNLGIGILGKCRKYLQIFKWIAFACFLSAFVFCIVFLVGSKSLTPNGSSSNVSLVDTINSSIVDTIAEDTKEQKQSQTIMVNGHECVDLGLSVKWATCNVGAEKPEDFGDYFAWGETEPKTVYSWETYKYGTAHDQLTKYCSRSRCGKDGFTDRKIVLDPEDDAATANWGGNWRIPTKTELEELSNNCILDWTIQNGVNGYKVKGPNGNSIFFPAAGYVGDRDLRLVGTLLYWSSWLYVDEPGFGWHQRDVHCDACVRYCGLSVRPVCK